MISADRFIETSEHRDAWLEARRDAVTATEVAKASTPAGFLEAVQERANPTDVEPNAFMEFGSQNEDWIARYLKREFGLMPNRWLIAAENNPAHMATPDALSLDHSEVGEIKTGGKEITSVPLAHKRQMNWQFYCTGAQGGRYAFMLRADVNGFFVPAWLEPRTWLMQRDDELIEQLIVTADRLVAAGMEKVA